MWIFQFSFKSSLWQKRGTLLVSGDASRTGKAPWKAGAGAQKGFWLETAPRVLLNTMKNAFIYLQFNN